MSAPVDVVLSTLDKVKKSGKGWLACCPAHDDRSPSLSIAEGDDGRVLLHCYAGCDTRAVVESAGLKMADLFPEGLSLEVRQQYQRRSLEAARDHARLRNAYFQQVGAWSALVPDAGCPLMSACWMRACGCPAG